MSYEFLFDDENGVRHVEIDDIENVHLSEYCKYFARYLYRDMFMMKGKGQTKYHVYCLEGVQWKSKMINGGITVSHYAKLHLNEVHFQND